MTMADDILPYLLFFSNWPNSVNLIQADGYDDPEDTTIAWLTAYHFSCSLSAPCQVCQRNALIHFPSDNSPNHILFTHLFHNGDYSSYIGRVLSNLLSLLWPHGRGQRCMSDIPPMFLYAGGNEFHLMQSRQLTDISFSMASTNRWCSAVSQTTTINQVQGNGTAFLAWSCINPIKSNDRSTLSFRFLCVVCCPAYMSYDV
jgi:hypothetical protein